MWRARYSRRRTDQFMYTTSHYHLFDPSDGSWDMGWTRPRVDETKKVKDNSKAEVAALVEAWRRATLKLNTVQQLLGPDDQSECTICMNELCDTLVLPCAHDAMCSGCAAKVQSCPLCREQITRRINLHTN